MPQAKLEFNPGLDLKWPGTPSESNQIIPTESGDQKHYNATYTEKLSDDILVFSAAIIEYPDHALDGTAKDELVAAYLSSSNNRETSHKQVIYGSKKHPGLEVTTHKGNQFGRRLVIMAGRRLYEVAATGTAEDLLSRPEVVMFFDSLSVDR